MSALLDGANALWAAETAVKIAKNNLSAAMAEMGAPTGLEAVVSSLLDSSDMNLIAIHRLIEKHLRDSNQPVPASGGGNKT